MVSPRIFTIGVYGSTELDFFSKLESARIDLFCDVRRRRGVRGRQYAFVNSLRLQARLSDLGIAYTHLLELAPTQEIRKLQATIDKTNKIAKRKRGELAPLFVDAYQNEILSAFSAPAFLADLQPDVKAIAFFCVEREPEACHRLLIAQDFANHGLEIEHL